MPSLRAWSIALSWSLIACAKVASDPTPNDASIADAAGDEVDSALEAGGDDAGDASQDGAVADSATLSERISAHGFPKLANQYQFFSKDWPTSVPSMLHDLAYWDLGVVDIEGTRNFPEYLGPSGIIRTANPNTVLVTYISSADAPYGEFVISKQALRQQFNTAVVAHPNWKMRDTTGQPIHLYEWTPGQFDDLLNETNGELNTYLADLLQSNVISTGLVDGIYFDWASTSMSGYSGSNGNGTISLANNGVASSSNDIDTAWVAGLRNLFTLTRAHLPAGGIVLGNSGWNTDPIYTTELNGVMIENFLAGAGSGGNQTWAPIVQSYATYARAGGIARLPFIMANGTTGQEYGTMRFALATALMFDGYFCFTNRDNGYMSAWWYDEYAVDSATGHAAKSLALKGWLGAPLGDAYDPASPTDTLWTALGQPNKIAETHAWRRDFTHGVVVVNPSTSPQTISFSPHVWKITGTIDPTWNDGTEVASINLAAGAGAVFVTR